jgi:hypothetical protein
MDGGINWQRMLIFAPVAIALGILEANGPEILGKYARLLELIVPLLFIALFLLCVRMFPPKS